MDSEISVSGIEELTEGEAFSPALTADSDGTTTKSPRRDKRARRTVTTVELGPVASLPGPRAKGRSKSQALPIIPETPTQPKSASTEEVPPLEGWLHKKAAKGRLAAFSFASKRYFLQSGDQLLMLEKPSATKVKRRYDLALVASVDVPTTGTSTSFPFEIRFVGGKVLDLRCASSADRAYWVQGLQRTCPALKRRPPTAEVPESAPQPESRSPPPDSIAAASTAVPLSQSSPVLSAAPTSGANSQALRRAESQAPPPTEPTRSSERRTRRISLPPSAFPAPPPSLPASPRKGETAEVQGLKVSPRGTADPPDTVQRKSSSNTSLTASTSSSSSAKSTTRRRSVLSVQPTAAGPEASPPQSSASSSPSVASAAEPTAPLQSNGTSAPPVSRRVSTKRLFARRESKAGTIFSVDFTPSLIIQILILFVLLVYGLVYLFTPTHARSAGPVALLSPR